VSARPARSPQQSPGPRTYVYPGTKARRNHTDAIAVRVVEYTLAPGDVGAEADRTYRLLTTITDPDAAPADELAQLYAQRWEIRTPDIAQ